jgi:hypothetical protein
MVYSLQTKQVATNLILNHRIQFHYAMSHFRFRIPYACLSTFLSHYVFIWPPLYPLHPPPSHRPSRKQRITAAKTVWETQNYNMVMKNQELIYAHADSRQLHELADREPRIGEL